MASAGYADPVAEQPDQWRSMRPQTGYLVVYAGSVAVVVVVFVPLFGYG